MKRSKTVKPGGVPEYIAACPKAAHAPLKQMRAAIREVTRGAIETVSYFDMPGYSYPGYPYNGMFAWFSFKAPFVRLHIRPQAITKHKKDLQRYTKTAAIVSFPTDERLPKALIQKLVKASLADMKAQAKAS